jgi:hypothetical protein
VTEVMLEKEESSVKLKSEIVLLQNKLDESQTEMTRKTNKMRGLLNTEAKDEVQKHVLNLETTISNHEKTGRDQAS